MDESARQFVLDLARRSGCLAMVMAWLVVSPVDARQPPDPGFPFADVAGPVGSLDGLQIVTSADWDETAVRRVMQAFAFGGRASDQQISLWAAMAPAQAIAQILTFEPVNARLSPPMVGDRTSEHCHSLTELQAFWSSDDPANPVRQDDRAYFEWLAPELDYLSPLGLYVVWPAAARAPGCNGFLHKVAFYVTNYHAAIHVEKSGVGLIRTYYDDVVASLGESGDFIDLMTVAASHPALAIAYGHAGNRFNPFNGEFEGNDDFAREYFQLLFGIEGTTEDPDYHENVTIEHNAWLLTGMFPDRVPGLYGSEVFYDWFVAPIDFSDHVDADGNRIFNRLVHYQGYEPGGSCLEVLGRSVCGRNAGDKLAALGPIAANHPESLDSVPLKLVRFFGDDVIDPAEMTALRRAWRAADFDLLAFLRAYAISTVFHDPATIKYRSSFDRNLTLYNANEITGEETWATPLGVDTVARIFAEGLLGFQPIRNVFGHQTGADAINDRYVFRSGWSAAVDGWAVFALDRAEYQLGEGGPAQRWVKDWGALMPRDTAGAVPVQAAAEWLWQRIVGDGGRHFDPLARAQVYALLAAGHDFGYVADSAAPDTVYRSDDLESGLPAEVYGVLEAATLDPDEESFNHRVGMAVNFISATPYAAATGGWAPGDAP